MKINLFLILVLFPAILFAQQIDSLSSVDYDRGILLFKSGNFNEAKKSFTRAINENPNDVDAYFNRGIINFKMDSIENACRDWNYASLACDSEAINLINIHCDSTYLFATDMPKFPGGEDKLFIFLMNNIKYPDDAAKNNISGKVFVQFVVGFKGDITNIKILKGKSFGLDEEAIRVIKLMPKWVPGKLCGKPVNVLYVLPISYKL